MIGWALANSDLIGEALVGHLVLVTEAMAISLAIACPLGIAGARAPRFHALVLGLTGAAYTIPALALFGLLIPVLGLGEGPALVAIVLYSLLVLVRTIVVALHGVPADVLEAADGMGYGRWRRLALIELPLAAPVIVSGLRVTVVAQISVATVAAFIGAGGLGDLIFQGITQDNGDKIVIGAVLVSGLAVVADALLLGLEHRLRVRGGLA